MARWVMKNNFHPYKIDLNQTFIALVKSMIFWVWFIITVYFDLNINYIDIKTVILYGLILIYVKIPNKSKIEANKDMAYRLLKILYDLKQFL